MRHAPDQYPDRYMPTEKDTDMDRVWEGLDMLTPGALSVQARALLAGYFTALLYKTRTEERSRRDTESVHR